jgi:hypothetical protein
MSNHLPAAFGIAAMLMASAALARERSVLESSSVKAAPDYATNEMAEGLRRLGQQRQSSEPLIPQDLTIMFLSNQNFSIQNVGLETLQILDITINDREECATVNPEASRQLGMNDNYSKSDIHKFWVAGLNYFNVHGFLSSEEEIERHNKDQGPIMGTPKGGYAIRDRPAPPKLTYQHADSLKPIMLKVGDIRSWGAECNIVRITITTNKGSVLYTNAGRL